MIFKVYQNTIENVERIINKEKLMQLKCKRNILLIKGEIEQLEKVINLTKIRIEDYRPYEVSTTGISPEFKRRPEMGKNFRPTKF